MGVDGEYRPLVGAALAGLCAAVIPGAAAACRLALVLGMDVSSSVDAEEDALQRQGLARALVSPPVMAAAFAAPGDPVAIAIFEWSGRYQQDLLVDWTLLDTPEDLRRVSEAIANSNRSYADFPTAAGYALGYAAGLLERAPDCLFGTLDLSGDGTNNDGFRPADAYKHFPFDGITVNGLPIGSELTDHGDDVVGFYRDEILHGPGAFLEIARDFGDFERAMRRKLERELGVRVLGALE